MHEAANVPLAMTTATPTLPVKIAPSPGDLVGSAIVALVAVFLSCTIVGIVLGVPLLFLSYGMGRKRDGYAGPCPHCGTPLQIEARKLGADCPACAKRVLVKPGEFVPVA